MRASRRHGNNYLAQSLGALALCGSITAQNERSASERSAKTSACATTPHGQAGEASHGKAPPARACLPSCGCAGVLGRGRTRSRRSHRLPWSCRRCALIEACLRSPRGCFEIGARRARTALNATSSQQKDIRHNTLPESAPQVPGRLSL